MSKRLLTASLLGAGAGLVLGPKASVFQPLGDLLLRLYKMLVLPLVVFTVLSSSSAITSKQLGRVGSKLLFWYALTAFAAALVGVAVAGLFQAGVGLQLLHAPSESREQLSPSPGNLIAAIVPENVSASVVEGHLIPVMFFSILFAFAMASLRLSDQDASIESLYRAFEVCARAVFRILQWVMHYAPIGTFALIAIVFSQARLAVVSQFARVIAAVYFGQLLAVIGCSLLLLAFRVRPGAFFREVKDALITAFVTGSSAATLPIEMETAKNRLELEGSLFGFALPLGVGVHKLGTAVYLAVIAIFAAHSAGLDLPLSQQTTIAVLAFIGSIATPPISGGAYLVLGFMFTEARLPFEVIGIVPGIPFLGKLNTPLNTLGRLVCTTLVGRDEERRRV